jgi:hypothetical protein
MAASLAGMMHRIAFRKLALQLFECEMGVGSERGDGFELCGLFSLFVVIGLDGAGELAIGLSGEDMLHRIQGR